MSVIVVFLRPLGLRLPKPDELTLARVNPLEIEGEARTGESFKILG